MVVEGDTRSLDYSVHIYTHTYIYTHICLCIISICIRFEVVEHARGPCKGF